MMKNFDSKSEARKILKEYFDKRDQIKELEKERILAYKKAKRVLIIWIIIFTFFLFVISTSIGTFSKNFHIIDGVSESVIIAEKDSICSEICIEEGGIYNDKESEIDVCECVSVGFFEAFSQNNDKIIRTETYKISNYSIYNFSILPNKNLRDCKDRFIVPNGYSKNDLYWETNYIIKTECPSSKDYTFIRLSRDNFNINQPPKIIISTQINDGKKEYKRYYRKLLSKNEFITVFLDSDKSFDPDGTIKNVIFTVYSKNTSKMYPGNFLNITLSGKEPETYNINITATDNDNFTSTDKITIVLQLWEINQERTLYLIFGGLISFILTMVGMYYFNRFLSYIRQQIKLMKAYKYFVKAIFFGVMLNVLCIMFTIRATFLPSELSRTLQESSFIPNTNIDNPLTSIIIKIVLLLGILTIFSIIIRKLNISGKNIYDYTKRKIIEHPFITIIILLIIIFLLINYIRLKF